MLIVCLCARVLSARACAVVAPLLDWIELAFEQPRTTQCKLVRFSQSGICPSIDGATKHLHQDQLRRVNDDDDTVIRRAEHKPIR